MKHVVLLLAGYPTHTLHLMPITFQLRSCIASLTYTCTSWFPQAPSHRQCAPSLQGCLAYILHVMQATSQLRSYTASFTYTCNSLYSKGLINSNATLSASSLCPRPQDYNRGSALVAYNSTSFYDDLLWGSAWMYYLTGHPPFLFACAFASWFTLGSSMQQQLQTNNFVHERHISICSHHLAALLQHAAGLAHAVSLTHA